MGRQRYGIKKQDRDYTTRYVPYCQGKTRYKDGRAAKAAAQHILTSHGVKLRSYECGRCNGWHLSSQADAR